MGGWPRASGRKGSSFMHFVVVALFGWWWVALAHRRRAPQSDMGVSYLTTARPALLLPSLPFPHP